MLRVANVAERAPKSIKQGFRSRNIPAGILSRQLWVHESRRGERVIQCIADTTARHSPVTTGVTHE